MTAGTPGQARTVLDTTVPEMRAAVAAAEPTLTALDEASGDGDFGSNLDEGLARAVARVDGGEPGWDALVGVFLDEVGGTSGPLFGLLFQAIGRATGGEATYDTALREGLTEGLAAIQRVGEAEVGDRTLVDALGPAVEAFRDAEVTAMVRASVDGALSTASIRARRGRSSYVGDKAIGHADPGAVGLALLLTVLAEPLTGSAAMRAERTRLLPD